MVIEAKKKSFIDEMFNFIKENNYLGKSGIVYCSTKADCETVSRELN
jgi:superfamily II DNA helicase RecQ